MLSVNRAANKLVEKLCDNKDEYGVIVSRIQSGATIIDAGIHAKGGMSVGKIITEICMGGAGQARILLMQYGDLELPTVQVETDLPAIATLGSQSAAWQIKSGDFSAIGSGPARALALKPKEIYEEIGYKDEADIAVIVLETNQKPPEQIVDKLASECKVELGNLFIILTPTTSVAGSVQISGRIVETGIHRLRKLGVVPRTIEFACGSAPVAPTHPELADAMGRTNDVILYGGTFYCALRHKDDEKLKAIVRNATSKASKRYGQLFREIFRQADYDFYKIDPCLFAPAALTVSNLETGTVHRAGKVNFEVLKRSIGLAA
jgi:methenyltetrahydromethanopterin cyclohydrolase